MKFICNKQITGVVSVSQYGKMHSVKINDNPIEELAAQGCEIKEGETKTFPARVVVVIQDLSDEGVCVPDSEELKKKIFDMIRMVENDARPE